MVAWKLGSRQIRQHPGRSLMTLLSVMIGVAAVVAVTISSETTDKAFVAMFESVTGHASLEITAAGGSSFEQSETDFVAEIPGIKTVAALLQRPTMLYFNDKRVKLITLGIDPHSYKDVHDYVITDGVSLTDEKGVLLEVRLAKNIGASTGDTVKLLTRRGLIKARIVGLYQSQEAIMASGGAGLMMTIPAAQYTSKMPGKVNAVELVLDDDADEEAIKLAIEQQLPKGLVVDRPSARSSLADETALSIRQGMLTGRAFLILVATLIIANTYLITVTQRRRQFGIMRAIGATQRQVMMILCGEALMIGLLGTLLGWFTGVLGAHFLTSAMGTLYQTTLPAIQITSASFLLAIIFGVSISLLGVWLPARRAGRLQPIEAMRVVLPSDTEGSSPWFSVLGIVLIVLFGITLAIGIAGWLPTQMSAWSGVGILAGVVLLMPTVVRPLSWLATQMIQPFLKVESRLARLQLLRNRTRTTLTIGVLFVSISSGIGLASAVMDNVNDVKTWYRRTMVADFFVRAMSPDMATGQAADIPDEVDTQIRAIDKIESIETVRFVRAKANDQSVIVIAHDADSKMAGAFERQQDSDRPRQSANSKFLTDDEVVVGSVFAERIGGLDAGDTLSLETEQGKTSLRVAAVVNDYMIGGQTIYMKRKLAEELLGVTGVDAYLLFVDTPNLSEVQSELSKVTEEQGLILESFAEVRAQIDERMSGVVAGLWAIVVLGFIVAALGVANTLTMNVLEQTQELGLLRIVGTTQWQIRRTILAEALMIGLMALVPGAAAGVGVAYLMNLTAYSVSGHAVAFQVHPLLLVGGFVIGMLVILTAAWFPAQRAAGLPLLESVRV